MRRLSPIAAALAVMTPLLLAGLSAPAFAQCGSASWYSLPRNKTANGERMNPSAMTAAHRTLPFNTKIRVTNQRNGKSVIVRVNDRGPFIKGRVLDLSKGAAAALGFVSRGHTKVCMEKN
jgi:rare lipoprotein A